VLWKLLTECFDICCAVNDHGGQVAPWEEENGFYGIMVRTGCSPSFLSFIYCNVFCYLDWKVWHYIFLLCQCM